MIVLKNFLLSCGRFIWAYFLPWLNFPFTSTYNLLTSLFFCSFYQFLFSFFHHIHLSFLRDLIIQLFKEHYKATVYILVHSHNFSMVQYIFEVLFTNLVLVFYIYSFYSFYNLQLFFRILVAYHDLLYSCLPCIFQLHLHISWLLQIQKDTFIWGNSHFIDLTFCFLPINRHHSISVDSFVI